MHAMHDAYPPLIVSLFTCIFKLYKKDKQRERRMGHYKNV